MSSTPSTPPPAPTRKSGVVIPFKARWHERLLAGLIYLLISGVTLTLRYKWVDRVGIKDGTHRGPYIFALWHNRLALSMAAYWKYVARFSAGKGLAAMVSASRDGGLLVAVFESFKVKPARGSSSRRGSQALRELTTWARKDYDLAITPDGPRGPKYRLQDGIISLAQITGRSIVPVTCNLGWKIHLKSWDAFQIPLPFSTCEIIFDTPVFGPRESTPEEREALRVQLENTMKSMTVD